MGHNHDSLVFEDFLEGRTSPNAGGQPHSGAKHRRSLLALGGLAASVALVACVCVGAAGVFSYGNSEPSTTVDLDSVLSVQWEAESASPEFKSFAGVPGTGLDLATGLGRIPVLDLSTEKKACNIAGEAEFLVPVDVRCERKEGISFPTSTTYVFNTYGEYDAQVNQWRSQGRGVGGMFVWSTSTRADYRKYFSRDDVVVAVVQLEHALYDTELVGDAPVLSPRVAKGISSLPPEYDETAYRDVIDNFGTSFVTRAVMGGMMELHVFLAKEAAAKLSTDAIEKNVNLDLRRRLGLDPSAILDPAYVQGSKGSTTVHWGGAVGQKEGREGYEAWLETIPSNVAVIKYGSKGLDSVVEEGPYRDNVARAAGSYFKRFVKCKRDGCLAHGSCTVAGSCQCDSGWIGRTCQVAQKDDGTYTSKEIALPPAWTSAAHTWRGDYNGDGLLDFLHYEGSTMSTAFSMGDGAFKIVTVEAPSSGWNANIAKAYDVDGDGRTDLQSYYDGNMVVFFSNGDSTYRLGKYPVEGVGWDAKVTWPVELYQRGRKVLVSYYKAQMTVFEFVEGKFTQKRVSVPDNNWSVGTVRVGRFITPNSETQQLLSYYKGNMVVFDSEFKQSMYRVSTNDWSAHTYIAADVNGDGLDDLVSPYGTTLVTFLCRGTDGFLMKINAIESSAVWNNGRVTVADFNGDGMADVASQTPSVPTTITTFLSDGKGGFVRKEWSDPSPRAILNYPYVQHGVIASRGSPHGLVSFAHNPLVMISFV